MNLPRLPWLLALAVLMPLAWTGTPAQGQVVAVTNLGGTVAGTGTNTSNPPVNTFYFAAKFTTGSTVPGSVIGATAKLNNFNTTNQADLTLEASIWTSAGSTPNTAPGGIVGVFDNAPVLNRETTADVQFTDTGITLAANTDYWLAIRATSKNGSSGALAWSTTTTASTSSYGWSIPQGILVNTFDGGTTIGGSNGWNSASIPSGQANMFELTAVPEPSTWAMMGLVSVVAGAAAWRHRRRATGVSQGH